jgi:uncharacterized membrane protein
MPPGLFFLPLLGLFFVLFVLLLLGLFVLIQIGAISVAFTKLGLSAAQVFWVLIGTLLGSMVNIPVYRRPMPLPASGPSAAPLAGIWKHHRRFSPAAPGRQTVAVNLGGCVVPTLLSIYFMTGIGISGPLILALLLVSFFTFKIARPVPGVGIGIPFLLPPLIAVLATWTLAPAEQAPQVAYISGSLGTLIGADILNLLRPGIWRDLQAPVLSIGGAGTFDGIFLSGILAVLLA